MKNKRTLILTVVFLLFLADWVVAYGFSHTLQNKILRIVNERANARVAFEGVRIHPLFLSVSAKRIQIFDPDAPQRRVLYGEHMSARVDPFALLWSRRVHLSTLRFEKFQIKVVQDMHGVWNVEKIMEPKSGSPDRFHGWKHQDWFFNWYERVKFAASPASAKAFREKAFFKIKNVELSNGWIALKG